MRNNTKTTDFTKSKVCFFQRPKNLATPPLGTTKPTFQAAKSPRSPLPNPATIRSTPNGHPPNTQSNPKTSPYTPQSGTATTSWAGTKTKISAARP